MTSAIRINHFTKEILISKSFQKAAMNPISTEYQDLKEVMNNHPDYRIAKRAIKKNANKKTYAGLNYEYMRRYIMLHSTPEEELAAIAEFENKILISECHSKKDRYPAIKKWFLDKYTEVAEFGTVEAEARAKKAS